jgi:hypothetical protein
MDLLKSPQTQQQQQQQITLNDILNRQQNFKKKLFDTYRKIETLKFEQNVKQQLDNVLLIKKKLQQQQQKQQQDEQLTDSDHDDDEIYDENDIDYNLHENLLKRHLPEPHRLINTPTLPPQLRSYQIYNRKTIGNDKIEITNGRKTSKWYWCMNKVSLSSEYERVRLKMYNLNKKCKNLVKKMNKKKVKISLDDDIDENNECTMVSQRCQPLKQVYFKRSLVKFDLLKPYMSLIKYLVSDCASRCSCMTYETCILCYLNKNMFSINLSRYKFVDPDEILKHVFMDHCYTKIYRPVEQIGLQNFNDIVDLNSSTSSTLSSILPVVQLSPSQTPPPTPKSPSTSSVLSNNTDLDGHDIVLTESNINNNNRLVYNSNKNKYCSVITNTTMMINNDILLDAGSELDPNDVHKLPNIYEE